MAVDPVTSRLAAIGNICAQWAYLEYLIAQAIWAMLSLDEEAGKIVTGGLDIRARLNMAVTLGQELGAPERLIAALMRDRAAIENSMLQRRNQAVHGIGFSHKDEAGDDVWVEAHKSKKQRRRQHLPGERLTALGNEIHDCAMRLWTELHTLGIVQENGNFSAPSMAANMRKAASEIGSSSGS